jgi:hypothetical protein
MLPFVEDINSSWDKYFDTSGTGLVLQTKVGYIYVRARLEFTDEFPATAQCIHTTSQARGNIREHPKCSIGHSPASMTIKCQFAYPNLGPAANEEVNKLFQENHESIRFTGAEQAHEVNVPERRMSSVSSGRVASFAGLGQRETGSKQIMRATLRVRCGPPPY